MFRLTQKHYQYPCPFFITEEPHPIGRHHRPVLQTNPRNSLRKKKEKDKIAVFTVCVESVFTSSETGLIPFSSVSSTYFWNI